jgi:hypothetical protein
VALGREDALDRLGKAFVVFDKEDVHG